MLAGQKTNQQTAKSFHKLSLTAPPSSLFTAAIKDYHEASATNDDYQRIYQVAGLNIYFKFAGEALVLPFTRALSHLESTHHGVANLVVHIWDSQSTGTPISSLPWSQDALKQIDNKGESAARLYYADSQYLFLSTWRGNMLLYDRINNLAVYWIQSPEDLMQYEMATPLRYLLHWFFSSHGMMMVHAAAVGDSHGMILLTGKSGSGKSTTAITCLAAGLEYSGDDYSLVSQVENPEVYSIYNSARLLPRSFELIDTVSPDEAYYDPKSGDKGLLFVSEILPHQLKLNGKLRALVSCSVTDNACSSLSMVNSAELFRALAPSTLFQIPGGTHDDVKKMADLVRSLPCWHLDLGADTEHLPKLLEDLIRQ